MKYQLIFYFILISFQVSASKLLTASCQMGSGCTFQISEADASDYDLAYGRNDDYYANLPEKAIVVDAKIDGKWEHYVETKITRSQLDKFYGGDGFTIIYPFNPDFQPRDGEWKINIGTVNGDICYGQESNLFKSALQGMSQRGNVNFPKPFHARFLMNSSQVKWQKIRPDLYKATLGNPYMNLKFDVQIINKEKIEGMFTVTIKVPTKETCINKIPITYTLVKAKDEGDGPWEGFLEEDDLLPVKSKEDKDDLLPVNPKKDDLLPVESGTKSKPDIPRLDQPNVPRIEDKPKAKVERLQN